MAIYFLSVQIYMYIRLNHHCINRTLSRRTDSALRMMKKKRDDHKQIHINLKSWSWNEWVKRMNGLFGLCYYYYYGRETDKTNDSWETFSNYDCYRCRLFTSLASLYFTSSYNHHSDIVSIKRIHTCTYVYQEMKGKRGSPGKWWFEKVP